ncbi:MAG: M3 family oligoendopeptidase [Spirochaetaceae bacterium]|nr:M3 family oligoendopeptidase [Spirochaetaceae bacterium]
MDAVYWNLESIYSSLESESYLADKNELADLSATLVERLSAVDQRIGGIESHELASAVRDLNRLSDLSENLGSYIYALWSTNTADEHAQREMDDLDARNLALKDALVRFRAILGDFGGDWKRLIGDAGVELYTFWLEEQRFFAGRQMSGPEESLAADLQRSGGDAWDRLHGKLSSSLSRPWDGGEKTVTELRAMAYDPDRHVRRKAWEEEIAAWKSAEISFAAALNGVKGTTATLNDRRGWGSTLEKSLVQNRLSRTGLDAMLGVMTESLPMFRDYFRAKAAKLGLSRLSWYDLFAPIPSAESDRWTWERVKDFIPGMFDTLSADMGDFARRAFDSRWVDAAPRPGKVGGAYCTNLPLTGESRILCNFDGSFDSVSTVAHELGHAWHGEVVKNLDALNREYPMTLAETASIFSETLVFRSALAEAPPEAKPAILDTYLMGAAQVIVDILSRFHFESALMRLRPGGEVSPRELTELMLDAQARTYGNALEQNERHGWMWAVKGHYYSPDLAFYNFPYAFGQLFALSLYSLFEEEGPEFATRYNEILRRTGSQDAVSVARSAGFDIESPDFWRRGIKVIESFVKEFQAS